MGSRKTLILIAAVAIGAVGAFILWAWLGGVQDRANKDAATTSVWVVRQEVPQGKFGQELDGYVQQEKIQTKFVPANAVRNLNDLKDRQSATALPVNQIITSTMFVDPSQASSGFASRLKQMKVNGTNEDMVTYTVSVDQVHGAAGLISPGDYVNVMYVSDGSSGGDTGVAGAAPTGGGPLARGARYVYEKAEVLAVDQKPKLDASEQAQAAAQASSKSGDGADTSSAAKPVGSSALITFRVSTDAAQILASVKPENIYLSLVGADYVPRQTKPVDPNGPLPAENGGQLTPYGPTGPQDQK